MKKIVTVLTLVFILSLSAIPANAQSSCNYSCYFATVIRLKNSNGTNFNGTARVTNGAGATPNNVVMTFIDGLAYYNGNVVVLSAYSPYTWNNIGVYFYHPSNGTWIAHTAITARYSSPPTIPSVTTATKW